VTGQQVAADKHRLTEGGGDTREWVEADWDESSEDGEPIASHKAQHSGGSGVGGRSADTTGLYTAGVPAGVKGVKADNNWLDDDFDS
jgi:hypothetical protein